MIATSQRELAANKVNCLNAIGAFVDRRNTNIAVISGSAGFFNEAHAAMDLNPMRRYFNTGIRRERFGNRGQEIGAILPMLRFFSGRRMAHINGMRASIGHGA